MLWLFSEPYEAIVFLRKAGIRSSRVGLNWISDDLAWRLKVQKGQFSSLLETALPQESQWITIFRWKEGIQNLIENSIFDQQIQSIWAFFSCTAFYPSCDKIPHYKLFNLLSCILSPTQTAPNPFILPKYWLFVYHHIFLAHEWVLISLPQGKNEYFYLTTLHIFCKLISFRACALQQISLFVQDLASLMTHSICQYVKSLTSYMWISTMGVDQKTCFGRTFALK